MDVTLITRFIDARIGGIGTYAENVYEGLKNREDVNLKVITQEDSILPYTDNRAWPQRPPGSSPSLPRQMVTVLESLHGPL